MDSKIDEICCPMAKNQSCILKWRVPQLKNIKVVYGSDICT